MKRKRKKRELILKLIRQRLCELEINLRNVEAELQIINFKIGEVLGNLKRVDLCLKDYNVGRVYDVNKPRIIEAIEKLRQIEGLVESIRKSVIFWMKKHAKEVKKLKETETE